MSRTIGFGLLSVLCLFVGAATARSESKPVLAVLPLEPQGMSTRWAIDVSREIQARIEALGCFELVPAGRIELAMSEHGGAVDPDSALAMASDLGASKLVRGTAGRSGNRYQLDLVLVDVPSGIVETTASIKEGCLPRDLSPCLDAMAAQLSPCLPRDAASRPLRAIEDRALAGTAEERMAQHVKNLPLFRTELSPVDQGRLVKYVSQREIGQAIAVPALAGVGAALALMLVSAGMGGIAAEYAGWPLAWGLPCAVVGGFGIELIVDANAKIRDLIRETERVRMGFNFDPKQRLYGFSISYAF